MGEPEAWMPIPGYEGHYEVSDRGSVRALARVVTTRQGKSVPIASRMLKPSRYDRANGHLKVHLTRDGVRRGYAVHRLVALAFIGAQPQGMVACHIDGNKDNNTAANIRYAAQRESNPARGSFVAPLQEDAEWRPVPGVDGYEVSSDGRVRSLPRTTLGLDGKTYRYPGRMLRGKRNTHGRVQHEMRGKIYQAHRLVMLAFVGEPPEGMEVCHNDGNPLNNHLSNLRYDSHRSNMGQVVEHGTAWWLDGRAPQYGRAG